MRKTLALALLALAAGAASGTELIEALVARVNDQPITRSEFETRCVVELRGAPEIEGRIRVLD